MAQDAQGAGHLVYLRERLYVRVLVDATHTCVLQEGHHASSGYMTHRKWSIFPESRETLGSLHRGGSS